MQRIRKAAEPNLAADQFFTLQTPKTVALIPARRGSQGLPGKNTAELGGRPLIEWTIRCALAAATVSEIYVTTDDPRVVEIARCLGATVINRPPDLASDGASMASVVAHAFDLINADRLVLLQPTSPFRKAAHVEEACELNSLQECAVISVVKEDHPREWAFSIDSASRELLIAPSSEIPKRRQDASVRYRLNGAIYVGNRDQWGGNGDIFTSHVIAFEMDRISSLDIDDVIDLDFARFLVESGRVQCD